MTTVGVAIASHNKPQYLAPTLACLGGQTAPAAQVIVVDDASEPPVADLPAFCTLLRRQPPHHLQAARNLGLAEATGHLILLLDDDCLVRKDFIELHLRRHEQYPGHLVVGPVQRIDYDAAITGLPFSHSPILPFWDLPPAPAQAGEHRTFERRVNLLRVNVPPWNLAPCSNNVSVSREALLSVGGYDEEYFGWGVDDVDLTYRLMKSGVPLLMDSGPVVYHQEHPRNLERQHEEELRNLWVFARKHGFWAYGEPPPEWSGPRRYPPEGAWFHAKAVLQQGEPPAVRVVRCELPGSNAPREAWPLDWVLGPYASRELPDSPTLPLSHSGATP